MVKLKFTKVAVNDLTEIWNYTIETWSEKQAEKYYNLILKACHDIERNPQRGKDYSEIYHNLKARKISKHLIFYRDLEDKSIEITRILHEQMDLKLKF
jgi:toxin ParE1/3/4